MKRYNIQIKDSGTVESIFETDENDRTKSVYTEGKWLKEQKQQY